MPEYPEVAKKAQVEGVVQVQVTVDEAGNVESATAIKEGRSDDELAVETVDAFSALRDAAERAALNARFSPTLLNKKPVKVTGVITYNFYLFRRSDDEPAIAKGPVLNGKALKMPAPEYPAAAKAVRAAGTVVVEVTVDENGNVISAAAVSGHPLLQSAAVTAAREAKFEPAVFDGKAVKFAGVITYNFVMPDKKQ
jgi:TonB family protein